MYCRNVGLLEGFGCKEWFFRIKIASQRFEKPEDNYQAYNYLDYHIEYQPDYDKCHYKMRIS